MKLIINPYNLKDTDIDEHNIKARAILINNNNEILVGNYNGTYLLPGGSIKPNEDIITCLIRELKEETGIDYNQEELISICELDYYQKNYPKRDGTIKNRLITTHYYISTYKEISTENQILTENEQKGNFKLELIPIEELTNIVINNTNNNPRNIYFQKELLTIIKVYKQSKYYTNNKKY